MQFFNKNRYFIKYSTTAMYYAKYILSEVLGKALPFLLLPILTRMFTQEEYGELTEFTVFYNFCFTIGAFSTFSFMRKLYFDKANLGQRYVSALLLSLIFIIFCVVALKVIQSFNPAVLGSIDNQISTLIVISTFSLVVYKIMLTTFNYTFNAASYLQYNLLLTLVNLAFTFLFLFVIDINVNGRVLGILTAPVILLPLAVYMFHLHHPINYSVKIVYMKDHTDFSFPLVLHSIMSWLRVSYDRILISTHLGLATLGEYSANAQIAMIYFVLYGALNQALAPKIIKKWFNGKEPLSEYGKIKLGEIYVKEGNIEEGSRLIKEGWIKAKLSKKDLTLLNHSELKGVCFPLSFKEV